MRRAIVTCAVTLAVAVSLSAGPREKPVAPGEQAPDFTLTDHKDATVKLSDSFGKRPAVLVFYRGYW